MPESGKGPQAAGDFTTQIRSLTNYQVWERVQSGILARPGEGVAEADPERFRLLLDELQWRHSGIEGPGAIADLDKAMAGGGEVH